MIPAATIVFGSGPVRRALVGVLKLLSPTVIRTCNTMGLLSRHLAASANPHLHEPSSVLCVGPKFGDTRQVDICVAKVRSLGACGTMYFVLAPPVARSAGEGPVFRHLTKSHVVVPWNAGLPRLLAQLASPGQVHRHFWRQFCAGPTAWDAVEACAASGALEHLPPLLFNAIEAVTKCAPLVQTHKRQRLFLTQCHRLAATAEDAAKRVVLVKQLKNLLIKYGIPGERQRGTAT